MRLLISSTPKILPSLLPEFHKWVGTLVTPRNGALKQALRLWKDWGCGWAIDNDAYKGFDRDAYWRLLDRSAGERGCLFCNIPDMVGTARGTHYAWLDWAWPVEERTCHPLAFTAQDDAQHCEIPWGEFDALFIGGTDAFKLSPHAGGLAREAARRGKHVHMGRANSFRRYQAAFDMGCHSVDGTNVCMFPDALLRKCLAWCRRLDGQPTFQGMGCGPAAGHEGHEGKDGGA